MASSHSGEDLHVRTLQALFRRLGSASRCSRCGSEGMPLDALTAARLARDGERPGPSGTCARASTRVFMLLAGSAAGSSRRTGRTTTRPRPRSARPSARVRVDARAPPDGHRRLRHPDLRVPAARGRPRLRDPRRPRGASRPATRGRRSPRPRRVRDAMLAYPELVAGTRDRLDTSLMKAMPGRLVSKGGVEAPARRSDPARPAQRASPPPRRAWRSRSRTATATIGAVGGDGRGPPPGRRPRGPGAARAGPLSPARPLDPHGRQAAEAIAEFELAPVGELVV